MQPAHAPNETAVAPGRLSGGGRALFIAQSVKFATRAISAMTLARLLVPADYGVFGMAAAVHGLLSMVRDLGTGAAVQQPELTRERFDVLCRFGLLGGLALSGLCAASGPAAAHFFGEARLPALLAGLALCFPFAGLAAPLQALLYREQRIATAATIDAISLATACVVAVAAAAMGAGAWALVAMAVTTELVSFTLAWRTCTWPPRRHRAAVPWRELLTFGAHLSGHNVAGYLSRTVDQIVVGRTSGATALGIYGRAVQATTLPMQFSVAPFTGWIIAMLARVQADAIAYRAFFRSALNGLAHLTLPLAAVSIAVPDLFIRLLLGARWLEAAPAVRWLGFGLAVQPWLFAPTWLLISTGRTRRLITLSGLALGVFIVLAVVARHSGITGMAAAMALATITASGGALAGSLGQTPALAADIVAASWRPWVLHTGLAAVLAGTARLLIGRPLPLILGGLAMAVAVYALVTLGGWRAARQECRDHFLWRSR